MFHVEHPSKARSAARGYSLVGTRNLLGRQANRSLANPGPWGKPLSMPSPRTPLICEVSTMHHPRRGLRGKGRMRGSAACIASPILSTARSVTRSKMRWTSANPPRALHGCERRVEPSSRTTSRRKAAFFFWDSASVTLKLRAEQSGSESPGSPAPEPKSSTVSTSAGILWAARRHSAKCSRTRTSGSRTAVRFIF